MPSNKAQSKAARRDAERAKALEQYAAQQRKDKRNRAITLTALIAGLAVLFIVIAYVLINNDTTKPGSGDPKPLSEVTAPTTSDASGGFPVGKDGAAGTTNEGAVEVGVYLDFLCPNCGNFEQINSPALDQMRAAGEVTVSYHPIAILDYLSANTEFSSRSAAAAAYVAEKAPEQFLAFNAAMFNNQPEENSTGLTNKEMQDIAEGAGVPAEVAKAIGDGTARATFGDWVAAQTAADAQNESLRNPDGGFGTPTITINGERWEGNWSQEGALAAAVAEAAGSGD